MSQPILTLSELELIQALIEEKMDALESSEGAEYHTLERLHVKIEESIVL